MPAPTAIAPTVDSGSETTATTSHSIDLPSGSGRTLVLIFSINGVTVADKATSPPSSDWVEVDRMVGDTITTFVWAVDEKSIGTNPTSLSITTSNSRKSSHFILRYEHANPYSIRASTQGGANNQTGIEPDLPVDDPDQDAWYVRYCAIEATATVTQWPSGYPNNQTEISNTGCNLWVATSDVETTTETTGTWEQNAFNWWNCGEIYILVVDESSTTSSGRKTDENENYFMSYPEDVQNGDTLVLIVTSEEAPGDLTADGWTLGDTIGAYGINIYTYVKDLGADEPSALSFNGLTDASMAFHCKRFRGVDSSSIVYATAGSGTTASGVEMGALADGGVGYYGTYLISERTATMSAYPTLYTEDRINFDKDSGAAADYWSFGVGLTDSLSSKPADAEWTIAADDEWTAGGFFLGASELAGRRWLGIAKPEIAKKAFIPTAVSPGSIWKLRVGSETFEYVSDDATVDTLVTHAEKAQAVTDGLVEAIGTTQFQGGADSIIGSLTSELVNSSWALMVTGADDGSPLDVEMEVADSSDSAVKVSVLQEGQAGQNAKQTIKWPKTPTNGNLTVGYQEDIATVAYNAVAGTLQTAIEGLSGIGAGNVTVTGSYTDGYEVEFISGLANTVVDKLIAYSTDALGTMDFIYEVATEGGLTATTWTMGALDGNSETFLKFTYNEADSHFFTGAATADEVLSALNSINALSGKVVVSVNNDGLFNIEASGLVGITTEDLEVSIADASGTPPTLTKTDGDTTAQTQVQTITVTNRPNVASTTSSITFQYNGLTSSGGVNLSTMTTSTIDTALSAISAPYTCTSLSKNQGENIVITLTGTDAQTNKGIVTCIATGTASGCFAISVRTTQEPKIARNEIQQIALHSDPDGGTFDLTFDGDTTGTIAFDASAATVDTALETLTGIGVGDVSVTGSDGGPWIVEFTGSLAATDVGEISGDGQLLSISAESTLSEIEIQVPTGPNWWTNAANWSGGAVPGNSDTAIFDQGSVPCLYGIDGVTAIAALDVYRTYTGQIGLNEFRETGVPETLDTHLRLLDLGSKITIRIGLGDEGEGPSLVRIDTDEQEADVKIPFSQQPQATQGYTIGLAGDLATVLVGNANVSISLNNGLDATVDTLRVAPDVDGEGAVVEWGTDATVTYAEVVAGTLRAGSVPTALTILSGSASVAGSGTCDQLICRNSTVVYNAAGAIGKQGSIESIDVNSSLLEITSTAHGLSSGDKVFVRGLPDINVDDGYYVITRIDANTFTLVGTAPAIPFGAVTPATVSSYYSANTAEWGLINTVVIGEAATLDFSEAGETRTIYAPVVLQAESALLLDPLVSIEDLRWHGDPSSFDGNFGLSQIYRRENAIAAARLGSSYTSGGVV